MIGNRFSTVDPDDRSITGPDAILAQATQTGLVRFNADGQIVPALGESWITTADGLSTIFRLHDRRWANGRPLTGYDVASRLETAMGERSDNALKPLLTAVETVVGMTDRVVEIRLRVPRPNLLQLFAQPELGIVQRGEGLGPWRANRINDAYVRLTAVDRAPPEPQASTKAGVDLRAERAALAIARFEAGGSDLVLGGTVGDWPIARAADLRPRRLRLDPARGLFGVAIVGRSAFLADARNRGAMAMAVDRLALAAMLAVPGWDARETLLPEQLDSGRPPARPVWAAVAAADRRVEAERRVAAWSRGGRAPPTLTIALPEGPGWRLVFARLATDWRAIGLTLERASPGAAADLRVIDAVAPNASANWFLSVTACEARLVCDANGDEALAASRNAATLPQRAADIAAADDASAARGSFIVLGAPIRWLLVDPSLTGLRTNPVAVHPLDELRPPR